MALGLGSVVVEVAAAGAVTAAMVVVAEIAAEFGSVPSGRQRVKCKGHR